ncbi:MAG: hypothetical protein BWY83_01990 [bacterium ADurb.Bin478]|nr:MAG: hypothetical protein BWY83_01990 [bacterium ADurb.Bin478]
MPRIDLHIALGQLDLVLHMHHDALHLAGHERIGAHQKRRAVDEPFGDAHVLDLVAENVLDAARQMIHILLVIGCGRLFSRLVRQIAQRLEVHLISGFELFPLVLHHARQDELIDGFIAVQHLDLLGFKNLEDGVAAHRFARRAGQIIDLPLLFRHAFRIGLQRDQLFFVRTFGGIEAQQFRQLFPLSEIGIALFQHAAVLPPDLQVLGLVAARQILKMSKEFTDQRVFDLEQMGIFLQGLARDVERQIVAVEHAADETQVIGQNLLGVMVHQHTANEQLHALLVMTKAQGLAAAAGHKEQRVKLDRRICGKMEPRQRIFRFDGDELEKLVILLFADLRFGLAPDRGYLVDLFAVDADGKRDKVGIFLYQRLDALLFAELFGILAQKDLDDGAAGRRSGRLDVIGALAVAAPNVRRLVCIGGARGQFDAFRDHKNRVKAHAEAADQIQPRILLHRHLFEKFAGAGMSDGADVLHHLLLRHADAGITNGKGLFALIQVDPDGELEIRIHHGLTLDRFKPRLVQRIRGIGDQFADENFTMGVERVRENMQQLLNLCFEFESLSGCFSHSDHTPFFYQPRFYATICRRLASMRR